MPSTGTCDDTISHCQAWSQCPLATEAHAFTRSLGLPHPDTSWWFLSLCFLGHIEQLSPREKLSSCQLRRRSFTGGGEALVYLMSAGVSCFYQNLSAQNSCLGPHPPLQMWSPNPVVPTTPFLKPGPVAAAFLHPNNWISAQEVLQMATLLFSQIPGSTTHTKILGHDALALHSIPFFSVLMKPPRPKEIISLITTAQLGRVSLKTIVRAAPEEKPRSRVQAYTKSYWPAGHDSVC